MQTTLLPSSEVCERLFIDRSTLSRWVARGKLSPAAKAPGRTGAFLFDADDVRALEVQG